MPIDFSKINRPRAGSVFHSSEQTSVDDADFPLTIEPGEFLSGTRALFVEFQQHGGKTPTSSRLLAGATVPSARGGNFVFFDTPARQAGEFGGGTPAFRYTFKLDSALDADVREQTQRRLHEFGGHRLSEIFGRDDMTDQIAAVSRAISDNQLTAFSPINLTAFVVGRVSGTDLASVLPGVNVTGRGLNAYFELDPDGGTVALNVVPGSHLQSTSAGSFDGSGFSIPSAELSLSPDDASRFASVIIESLDAFEARAADGATGFGSITQTMREFD